MAKSKKSASKNTASNKVDEGKVEARPIGQGKDPLAEGERLYNPTNTEAETHYEADRSELNDEEKASKIRGQNANERAEEHNTELTQGAPDHETPNQSQDDQAEVAAGRVEPGEEQAADDTPEETEVPELSDEEQAENAEDREEALAKDRKEFS